jgi:hypothetical protein
MFTGGAEDSFQVDGSTWFRTFYEGNVKAVI